MTKARAGMSQQMLDCLSYEYYTCSYVGMLIDRHRRRSVVMVTLVERAAMDMLSWDDD